MKLKLIYNKLLKLKISNLFFSNDYLTKKLHYKKLTNLHKELKQNFNLSTCDKVLNSIEQFKKEYPNSPLHELQNSLENLVVIKKQILEYKLNILKEVV